MIEAIIRELRVTDIRCHAEGCGAGPGEPCSLMRGAGPFVHVSRRVEHEQLVAEGWLWQEVDPTDVIASHSEMNRKKGAS